MAWEHKGYTIEVMHNGTFHAAKDDFEADGKTLDEVKAVIDTEVKAALSKKKLSLKVIGILRSDNWKCDKKLSGTLSRAIVTGINRTSRKLSIDGVPDNYRLDDILADTPENEALLRQYIEVSKEAERVGKLVEVREIKDKSGYGRLDASKYPEVIAELEKNYAVSVKGE